MKQQNYKRHLYSTDIAVKSVDFQSKIETAEIACEGEKMIKSLWRWQVTDGLWSRGMIAVKLTRPLLRAVAGKCVGVPPALSWGLLCHCPVIQAWKGQLDWYQTFRGSPAHRNVNAFDARLQWLPLNTNVHPSSRAEKPLRFGVSFWHLPLHPNATSKINICSNHVWNRMNFKACWNHECLAW